jgi:hypothetical protein
LPGEVVSNDKTFGILKLVLHPTSYDWQFLPAPGYSFTDSGSAVHYVMPVSARRLDAVSRASITPVTAALDDTFYAALTAYAVPESATAVNAALDYVAGPAAAVITAIHEARPR